MKFKNKIVWITGASSGAGEALAYQFASEGANLIISARREKELRRVKRNIKNVEVRIIPLDLEKHKDLPEIAEKALAEFGRIDVLFHNGGISQRSLANETCTEVDKRLMNINYFGAVILTKAILPTMIKRQTGQIAVMSSLTGKFGTPLRSAYAASKHALHGFFDSLRAEVHEHGIGITIICSGYIRTGIAVNAFTGNGSAQNTNDPGIENGMPPEVFAEKAVRGVYNQRHELIMGGKEKLGVYLKRFTPRLFDKIIQKQNVR